MRDFYRYLGGFSVFLSLWIMGVFSPDIGYLGFLIGIVGGYAFLSVTSQRMVLPTFHFERLRKVRIQFFVALLAFSHAFAAVIVELAVPNWLWLFLLIGGFHVGLELYLILIREPKGSKAKKPIKYSYRRARRVGKVREEGVLQGVGI